MPHQNVEKTRLKSLALRLEGDIRARGLSVGDRYLTGAEAARMLKVSVATAHRAMGILVDRELLVRRRRSGTFVGPAMESVLREGLRVVFVLVMERQFPQFGGSDLLLRGIRREARGASIQFDFLPEVETLAYVKQLLEGSLQRGELAGVVPMSCERDVYQFLAELGVPTVVLGSLYTATDQLCSIDVDNREAGRLLAEYLANRGHQRIAVFNETVNCPGDGFFHDGVSEALTAAKLSPSALVVRTAPDPQTVAPQVQQLLEAEVPPSGFIARNRPLADALAEAISRAGSSSGEEPEIVFQNHPALPTQAPPYAYVQPRQTFEEIAAKAGQILHQLSKAPSPAAEHILVPVELQRPSP